MRGRAVVALEEVLGRDLPVAVELRPGALEEAERVEVDPRVGDPLRDAVEELLERGRSGSGFTKISGPQVSSCSCTRPSSSLAMPASWLPRGAVMQPAVEPVRPCVVRALQRLSAPLPLADDRAAVPADVEERAERVLTVADDDHRDVSDPCRRERARLRHLSRVPDVLPRAAEDALSLELEDGGIRVPAPGQCLHVDRAHGAQASGGQAAARTSSSSSRAS